MSPIKQYKSHGNGQFREGDFKSIGENVIFEPGVLVFHPENIVLGSNIYIGHHAILKGYYNSMMEIGTDTWIGQGCFFHSAGGLKIGKAVGIGPMVKILTSHHDDINPDVPVLELPLAFKPVIIEDEAHIGANSVVLAGVTIGKRCQVGAGSVVTKNIPPFTVAVGNPARVIKKFNFDSQRWERVV